MRKLLLIAALSACAAFAAPTRIVDTVKYANNTNASGMIRIEWPAFTVSGTSVAAGFVQVNVVNGVLDVSLQPTDLATPSGTVYTARFYLQNSPVATEYWTVPTSASAVNLADVRTSPLSALSGLHDVSTSNDWTQIATPGTNPAAGYLRVYAKTGSGICWLSSAGTETCAGAGATWGAITGTLSSQSDLSTALADKASITGSYSNPSWITGLAWSKITSAPVASTTNGARVGSNDGVYLEPANPAIGFNAYYDSGWKFGNASPNNYASIITRDASGNLVFSVSSATGATGATPTFNSMTFSQSTRKLSGVTPGTASGEVVALNGSNQVDLALIPTGTSSSTVALGDHAHAGVYEPANANIQSHISSTSNPHSVTKTQVSLGNVDNYATASQAEAEAGTANDKFMTVLRTAQTITALQAFKSAGAGITCALGVCGADFSIITQYENSAGTPSSPVESGKRIATDTTNHRPYWALNNAWVRIMRYDEGALASHAHAASDVTSGTLAVAQGGTGLSSGTSGGVLAYTASGTLASSGALTANLPVIGGGAGAAPTVGTRSGNTTEFGTVTGAKTTGKQLQFDASGNIEASSSDVGGGSGGTITEYITLNTATRAVGSSITGAAWVAEGTNIPGGTVVATYIAGLAFDPTTDESMELQIMLPTGWQSGSATTLTLYTSNGSGQSGNVSRWQAQTACVADGEAYAASFNTAQSISISSTASGAYRASGTFSSLDMTGCAAGEMLRLRVNRDADATSGTDSDTADVIVVKTLITWVRTI